jgi:ABC-2 type transport system permease protein
MTAGVTQVRVVRSEWTKLRSLPSTAWCLLATLALVVGFGVVYSLARVTRPPRTPESLAAFDPTSVSLSGIYLAQIAVGVLGVLLVSGEYANGGVRTTFTAVPRRLPVLWGKAIVYGVTVLVVCVPATVAAFLAGQSILSSAHLDTSVHQPGVDRAVVGAALYLAAVGLLGLALGALVRNTAGSVAALLGALFAPQIVLAFLPETWQDSVYRYLPAPAGTVVTTVRTDPHSLGPWTGLGVLCLYTAVLLGLAAWRTARRDV